MQHGLLELLELEELLELLANASDIAKPFSDCVKFKTPSIVIALSAIKNFFLFIVFEIC